MVEADVYDAIIIGSGLGGLSAAACLAHEGKRVCVIERHDHLGGCASTYQAGSVMIEASLHATADPHDARDPKHAVLDRLGILDAVEWVPVGPLYTVRGGPLGDEPFVLGHGFDRVRADFRSRFAGSARGSGRLLDTMEGIVEALGNLMVAREEHSLFTLARGLAGMGPLVTGWHRSVGEIFAHELGDDEAAKCAVAANLPYYGNDPAKLWWLYFAVAQGGYLQAGGTFIKGGSSRLTNAFADVITNAGGDVITARHASAIELDSEGRVAGVSHRARDGGPPDRLAARMVLANCAPDIAAAMLPEDQASRFRQPYDGLELSTSVFSIHFGLEKTFAQSLPANYSTMLLPDWMTALADHATASELLGADPAGRLPSLACVNYAAIDSGLEGEDNIPFTITGVDRLANWQALSKPDEKARQRAWTDALTERLEREYPGFGAAVMQSDFQSARSLHDYLGTPEGAIYGFAMTPPQGPIWQGIERSPETAIPGLFLASSFAGSGGFSGAVGSGAQAAATASNFLEKSMAG